MHGSEVQPEYNSNISESTTKVIPPEWIAGIESDMAELRTRLESMSETINFNERNASFSAQQIANIQSREIKRERVIEALQTKIEKIERARAPVHEVIPTVQLKVIPKASPEAAAPIASQKDHTPTKHVAEMMAPRITLMPDMQEKIISHVEQLGKGGITRLVIAEMIGMPEGSFKKLMSRSNPLKSIGRKELSKLMAMTAPGTS